MIYDVIPIIQIEKIRVDLIIVGYVLLYFVDDVVDIVVDNDDDCGDDDFNCTGSCCLFSCN